MLGTSRYMLIADILREKGAGVTTTTPDTEMSEAIRLLSSLSIGALLVSDNGRSIDGILSERDIVRALASDESGLGSQKVKDLMTREVYSCAPESTIVSVMELMDQKQIRHVPVQVNGVLSGIVSIRDIVTARVREAEAESQDMADYISRAPLA